MTKALSIILLGTALALASEVRQTPGVEASRDGALRAKFAGTSRLPTAKGTLIGDRRSGEFAGKVRLNGMKPAALFGGDFNTYVMWIVGPDGITHNAGELQLNGSNSELEITTGLDRFGVMVTAEPHYLVDTASPFVVVEIAGKKLPAIEYRGFSGSYAYERDSIAETNAAEGVVETLVPQALTAVRLAERSAQRLCGDAALSEAKRSLTSMLVLIQRNADRHEIESRAKETIRLAVSAQSAARSCISEE